MDGKLNGMEPQNIEECFSDRLEKALKTYRMSELYLRDVSDDYGKLKIARLRLEFARHELFTLMKEARDKGINPMKIGIFNQVFNGEGINPANYE